MCISEEDLMKNIQVNARKSTINRTIKILLTILGIWPEASCVTFLRIFWFITLGVVQISQYQYLLSHFYSSDVFDLMDCFSSSLAFIKFFFKMLIFWWNQR